MAENEKYTIAKKQSWIVMLPLLLLKPAQRKAVHARTVLKKRQFCKLAGCLNISGRHTKERESIEIAIAAFKSALEYWGTPLSVWITIKLKYAQAAMFRHTKGSRGEASYARTNFFSAVWDSNALGRKGGRIRR